MSEELDPKIYGLPPRTLLKRNKNNSISFVMKRKSRIIMKDAETILKKIQKIREKEPEAVLSLETTAPVCSKSIRFLKEHGVDIFHKP